MPEKFFAKEVLSSLSHYGQRKVYWMLNQKQELLVFRSSFNWYPDIISQCSREKKLFMCITKFYRIRYQYTPCLLLYLLNRSNVRLG